MLRIIHSLCVMMVILSTMVISGQGVVLDCYSTTGYDYDGQQQTTYSGKPCLRWDQFDYYTAADIPDSTLYEAANYCRGASYHTPWCYFSESREWEICGINKCSDDVLTKCGQLSTETPTILGRNVTFSFTPDTSDSNASLYWQRKSVYESAWSTLHLNYKFTQYKTNTCMTYKLVVTDSVRYEDEQIYRVHYYNETMRCRMQTKKLELKGEPCGLVQVRSEKVIRNVTVEIEYYPPNNVLTNPEDFTRQWIHSSDHKNITLLLTIGIYEEELVQSDKYVLTILMINKSVNGEYMVYCGNELGYTDLVTVEIKEKPHDKEEYGEKQKSIEQASNKLVIWIVLGLCLLVTCIIIAVVLFVVIRKRRQNRKEKKESRVYNQTNVDIIRNSQHNPEDDLQGNQNVVSHEHDVAAEVPEYSRPLEKKTRENVHNTYLEVIEAGSSAKQHRAVDGKLLYAELDFDRNDTRSKGSVVKRPDSPTEYADIDCVKTKAEKDISNTAKEPENIYANS